MKKLINDPARTVREMLEGLTLCSEKLLLASNANVVIYRDLPAGAERKVAVISGGGSGHEPAHAGYVGNGMLSAAVAGDVFTSPDVDSILAAILTVAGPAGALLIVKNYTGDRLNFGLAAELATAQGIPTEVVVVADDVSLKDITPRDRRRGLAGTVLVHKIVGAAARRGTSLSDLALLGRRVANDLGTMGVGLGPCTVPAAGRPGFELAEDQIEFGLGIHGERGVRQEAMMSADKITDTLVQTVVSEISQSGFGECVLMVNGLGGTPLMELLVVVRRAWSRLREQGFKVSRIYMGDFMTALEMPGVSITVLPVEADWLKLLDEATDAPAWRPSCSIPSDQRLIDVCKRQAPDFSSLKLGPLQGLIRQVINKVANALESAETELTELDSKAGDGDLGVSMLRAAKAMREMPVSSTATPEAALVSVAHALQGAIGGSSGPFYATALMRAGRELANLDLPTARHWQQAFAVATAAVSDLGGAKIGDRTMFDALAPASAEWLKALNEGASAQKAFEIAVKAAGEGAMSTANMKPALGRATYLGDRVLGVADGGARAVEIWMAAIEGALQAKSG